MTLKTDYTTALNTALTTAYENGKTFVTTNSAVISSGLTSAAAQGLSTFTIYVTTIEAPETLKLAGDYLKAYLAGIYAALYAEYIYQALEVTLSLDTSTVGTNKIKFYFTF